MLFSHTLSCFSRCHKTKGYTDYLLPSVLYFDEFSFSYKFDNEGYLVELAVTYHGNSNKDYEDGMTVYYKYTWE